MSDLIIDDRHQARFKVHRSAFVSDDILVLEREHVFGKCWLYRGHTSELKKRATSSPAASADGR